MDFFIQKATSKDIDSIIHLIQAVWENMPQKDWFAMDNADYTKEIITTNKGCAYKVIESASGSLAGVFLTAFPGDSSENLGKDIGLSKDKYNQVAHMDSAVIAPAYRGHHLQQRLMSYAENDLKKSGYHYLCCTIHPDNKYSLNSALSLGYKIATICEKYGGYQRAVLVKEI